MDAMPDADRRKLESYLARSEADLLAKLELYDAGSKGIGDGLSPPSWSSAGWMRFAGARNAELPAF